MMGAIGTGNVAPGVCTLSLGTSGTIYAYFDRPFVDPAGEIAAFCDSTGGWLPLLCTMNVTNTTEIVKSLFGLDNAGLEPLAAAGRRRARTACSSCRSSTASGCPSCPSRARVFFGLDRRTFDAAPHRPVGHGGHGPQPGLRLRAACGSWASSRPRSGRPGGGAKSRLWLQIVADVFGTPGRDAPKKPEAAAYGAALQSVWNWRLAAGEKAGHRRHRRPDGWPRTSWPREPDPKQRRALRGPPRRRFNDALERRSGAGISRPAAQVLGRLALIRQKTEACPTARSSPNSRAASYIATTFSTGVTAWMLWQGARM